MSLQGLEALLTALRVPMNSSPLLAETVREAKQEVEVDRSKGIKFRTPPAVWTRCAPLYNSMEKLELHMNKSRRILNDLRSLRRLLSTNDPRTRSSIPDAENQEPASRILSPIDRAQEKSASLPSALAFKRLPNAARTGLRSSAGIFSFGAIATAELPKR